MKKIINKKTIAVCLTLFILVSCTHYVYIARSPWQSNTIVVDGKPTEWPTPLKYYDDKSKLQYAVTNDKENLYLCIKATEEQTQIKILRAGMQIWIDTTGKNEHRVGILFPMASMKQRFDQTTTAPKESNTEESTEERKPKKKQDIIGLRNTFLKGYKEMQLSGFQPPINGMNPIQTTYGIVVSVNWDTIGIMTYEAVIPFKTFYKDAVSLSDSLKCMGISIVLNALPSPSGGGGHSGGGGGGHGGGGGGMGGGGMGAGGMGGGGMGGRGMGGGGMRGGGGHAGGGGATQGSTYLYATNTIKKIFQLAVKKK